MTSPADRDLTTIVVNWNTVDLLDECLRSIERRTPAGWRNSTSSSSTTPRATGRPSTCARALAARSASSPTPRTSASAGPTTRPSGVTDAPAAAADQLRRPAHRGLPRRACSATSTATPGRRSSAPGSSTATAPSSGGPPAGCQLSLRAAPTTSSALDRLRRSLPGAGRHLPAPRHRRAVPARVGVERGDARAPRRRSTRSACSTSASSSTWTTSTSASGPSMAAGTSGTPPTPPRCTSWAPAPSARPVGRRPRRCARSTAGTPAATAGAAGRRAARRSRSSASAAGPPRYGAVVRSPGTGPQRPAAQAAAHLAHLRLALEAVDV